MDNRYLYRAKHSLNSKKWHIGNLFEEPDGLYLRDNKNNIMVYIQDPSTICQCTGLKDKHGKLIFENDIVSFQFDNDDCPFPNKDTKKRIGKVFFSDFRASWSIAMGKNGSKSLNNDLWKYVQNGNRVEVIGSAIDNPELLGVGL